MGPYPLDWFVHPASAERIGRGVWRHGGLYPGGDEATGRGTAAGRLRASPPPGKRHAGRTLAAREGLRTVAHRHTVLPGLPTYNLAVSSRRGEEAAAIRRSGSSESSGALTLRSAWGHGASSFTERERDSFLVRQEVDPTGRGRIGGKCYAPTAGDERAVGAVDPLEAPIFRVSSRPRSLGTTPRTARHPPQRASLHAKGPRKPAPPGRR